MPKKILWSQLNKSRKRNQCRICARGYEKNECERLWLDGNRDVGEDSSWMPRLILNYSGEEEKYTSSPAILIFISFVCKNIWHGLVVKILLYYLLYCLCLLKSLEYWCYTIYIFAMFWKWQHRIRSLSLWNSLGNWMNVIKTCYISDLLYFYVNIYCD